MTTPGAAVQVVHAATRPAAAMPAHARPGPPSAPPDPC